MPARLFWPAVFLLACLLGVGPLRVNYSRNAPTSSCLTSDSSSQPPPLLRAFDDDWKAFRAREEGGSADPSELEDTPLGTELFSSFTPLPVSGNSTVVGRVGGCDVVLARRVGPGEVLKQLHLLPLSQRRGVCLVFVMCTISFVSFVFVFVCSPRWYQFFEIVRGANLFLDGTAVCLS